EVMRHYAGSLTALTSEGFTALFGAPVAQEDHAQRAVQAALTLRDPLPHPPARAGRAGGGRLPLQMGLHSGLVVGGWLGQDPQRRYTAVGAPLHLARRLQEQATPGTILLRGATYHLVQAEGQGAPCGHLDIEGQPRPLPVYAVQGLCRHQGGVAGRGRWVAST